MKDIFVKIIEVYFLILPSPVYLLLAPQPLISPDIHHYCQAASPIIIILFLTGGTSK